MFDTSKIVNFLWRNRKLVFYSSLIIAFFWFVSGDTFAANNTCWPGKDQPCNEFIQVLNSVFKFIAMILWILTNFVWLFLNPAWTNGSIIWLDMHLKTLWILVSNVVYFIFALLLIAIAFMNIIWKGEKWELKQALPKFILWVLMVPISWFLVQFMISLSSILWASILQLPHDILVSNNQTFQKLEKTEICTYIFTWKDAWWEWKDIICKDDKKKSVEDLLKWESAYSLLSVYTYWVFALDDTQTIFKDDVTTDTITTIFDLWFQTIISLLFIVIFFILVIALGLWLFVRWVWLWLYTIFSPVFWLLIFFWKEWDSWFMEWKFSFTELIALTLVPVYVAASLSFWLLFLFVAWQWLSGDTSMHSSIFNISSDDKTSKIELLWWSDWNWITFEMEWTFANSWTPDLNKVNTLFDSFKWWIWSIVMQLFALVILWISVMASMNQSKITWEIIKPFVEFWDAVWWLIKKSPTFAPIIPGWISAQWLSKLWRMPMNAMEQRVSNKISPFQDKINSTFWVSTIDVNTKANLRRLLSDWVNNEDLWEVQSILRWLVEKHGTSNSEVQSYIKMFWDKLSDSGLVLWKWLDVEDLVKWWKLSKVWYWILHNNSNMSASTTTNSNWWDYAAAHVLANSSYKSKKEGELWISNSDKDELIRWEKILDWNNIKININSTTWKVILWNPEWKSASMTFENYSSINQEGDYKKLYWKLKDSDRTELRNLIKNVDMNDPEKLATLKELFPKIQDTKDITSLLWLIQWGKSE